MSLEVETMMRPIIPLPEVSEPLVLNISHGWDLCFCLVPCFLDSVLYVLNSNPWTEKDSALPSKEKQSRLRSRFLEGGELAAVLQLQCVFSSAGLQQRSLSGQSHWISYWARDAHRANTFATAKAWEGRGLLCNDGTPPRRIHLSPLCLHFVHS